MRTLPETRSRSAQEAGKRARKLSRYKANQACSLQLPLTAALSRAVAVGCPGPSSISSHLTRATTSTPPSSAVTLTSPPRAPRMRSTPKESPAGGPRCNPIWATTCSSRPLPLLGGVFELLQRAVGRPPRTPPCQKSPTFSLYRYTPATQLEPEYVSDASHHSNQDTPPLHIG